MAGSKSWPRTGSSADGTRDVQPSRRTFTALPQHRRDVGALSFPFATTAAIVLEEDVPLYLLVLL